MWNLFICFIGIKHYNRKDTIFPSFLWQVQINDGKVRKQFFFSPYQTNISIEECPIYIDIETHTDLGVAQMCLVYIEVYILQQMQRRKTQVLIWDGK